MYADKHSQSMQYALTAELIWRELCVLLAAVSQPCKTQLYDEYLYDLNKPAALIMFLNSRVRNTHQTLNPTWAGSSADAQSCGNQVKRWTDADWCSSVSILFI